MLQFCRFQNANVALIPSVVFVLLGIVWPHNKGEVVEVILCTAHYLLQQWLQTVTFMEVIAKIKVGICFFKHTTASDVHNTRTMQTRVGSGRKTTVLSQHAQTLISRERVKTAEQKS